MIVAKKWRLGTHVSLRCAVEHLASTGRFLAVPFVTGPPVEAPELIQEFGNVQCFHEGMIVVGQHAPGNGAGSVPLEHIQQRIGEGLHTRRGKPNVGHVLITGGCDVKINVAAVRTVQRRMPWATVRLAPGKDLLPLLSREPAPEITRPAHRYRLPIRSDGCMESRL